MCPQQFDPSTMGIAIGDELMALAVIGKHWLRPEKKDRLADPEDPVRLELRTAIGPAGGHLVSGPPPTGVRRDDHATRLETFMKPIVGVLLLAAAWASLVLPMSRPWSLGSRSA